MEEVKITWFYEVVSNKTGEIIKVQSQKMIPEFKCGLKSYDYFSWCSYEMAVKEPNKKLRYIKDGVRN